MRIGAILAAIGCAAAPASAAPHPVVDRLYHCTLIARTTEFPGGFEAAPTINAHGQVAFTAVRADDVHEIRVGRGDTDAQGVPTSHVTARASLSPASGAQFQQLGPPAIDGSGRVAFWGERPVPPFGESAQGLFFARFDSGGASIQPAIDETAGDPSSDFVSFFDPLPSWQGSLLFFAQYREQGSQHGALFRGPSIAFDPELPPEPSYINDYAADSGGSSAFVFRATVGSYPDQEEQLDLDGTHVFDSIALPGAFSGVSIASSAIPIVSYARFEADTTTWQLRVRAADPPAIYVDSTEDPIFAASTPGATVPTSVNGFGEVALLAGDGAFPSRRLFVADGDEIQRVVCDNAVFGGLIGARAINSDGQIAFLGADLDPPYTGYVARADPLQGLPTSCVALGDGTPCADDDPETAATCTGGVCTGEGVDRPTSCAGLEDDTPCDDGDPATLAYCAEQACVAASFEVPEPAAGVAGLVAAVALAQLRSRDRSATRRPPERARRGIRAGRTPARW